MTFNPSIGSQNILRQYISYITSTFYIKDAKLRGNFEKALENMGLGKGPYIDFTDSFLLGANLTTLIEEGVISKGFRQLSHDGEGSVKLMRPLYIHQEKAIRKIGAGRNVVVTTGTGSGKTESFLYPILNSLMHEKEQGTLSHGVRALLIYPMNALANDQVKRMREVLLEYPDITFGSFTGETEEDENKALAKYKKLNNGSTPISNERISRKKMKAMPPNILITNYAMLEYLLIRPDDNVFFDGSHANSWKYIVLDEAHTYTGAIGIEVSMLMSRLKNRIHRKGQIQYILTSATLGDEKDNQNIVEFAQNLSASSVFTESDIIRAERHSFDHISAVKEVDINFYKTLYSILKKAPSDIDERMKESIFHFFPKFENQNIDYKEMLFDIILEDKRYNIARKLLQNDPLDVQHLAKKLNLTQEDLVGFVEVANKAKKNNAMLLDARYHMFIRSLEGCFCTLDDSSKVSLVPKKREEGFNEQYGERYYEISVCRFCGEVYLLGGIHQETKEFQQLKNTKKEIFILIDEKNQLSEYMIKDKTIIKGKKNKENDFQIFDFDTKTGKTRAYTGESFGSKVSHRYLVKSSTKQIEPELNTCYFCGKSDKRSGVLRDFYLGQAAATSVLGTSLYEEIPGTKLKVVEKILEATDEFDDFFGGTIESYHKKLESTEAVSKQLLVFSDSRQEAAYFASYFDVTYQNILRRRLLIEALRQTRETRGGDSNGYELKHVVDHLENLLRQNSSEDDDDPRKEAWKVILYELSTNDRNSLENLGLLHFHFIDKLGGSKFGAFEGEDANTLYKVVAEAFKKDGMIDFPLQNQFTKEDFGYFTYSEKRQYLALETDSKYENSFVPKKSNRFTKYISKVAGIEEEQARNYLRNIWKGRFERNGILLYDNTGNKAVLKNSHLRIQLTEDKGVNWLKCNKCGNLTPHNIQSFCTAGHCDGRLEQVDPLEYKKNNHYMRLYQHISMSPMRIREHTAQLSPEKAKEYQEQFILKKINILSCSTTFEMGVDVGDLETVFMKNIPPSPANYTQRAGRAGRRADAVAYALTFCKTGSHDLTFFKHPERMIRGKIRPPKFNIHNEKIVKRHIQSFLISSFWKLHPILYKDVVTFYEEKNFKLLMKYLRNNRELLIGRLYEIVPQGLHHKIKEWYEEFLSQEGIFNNERQYFLAEEKELVEALEEYKKDNNTLNYANRISYSLKKLREKNILNYLSSRNVMPKYGFPIDSVELITDPTSIEYRTGSNDLRLQRDLIQAISEYAPGSQVIADGNLYTSQYIKRPPQKVKEWEEMDFVKCKNPECGHLNIHRHYPFSGTTLQNCKVCETPLEQGEIKTMIKPEYGFIISADVKKAGSKKPARTYRGEVYYIGNQKELLQERNLDIGLDLKSTSNDELAVINNSEFLVCPQCGHSELSNSFQKSKVKSHNAPNGRECHSNLLCKRSIGHTFQTDVTTLAVSAFLPYEEAYSILYAILEGLSKSLSIERNDIDGTVDYIFSKAGNTHTRFILFDTVPGGAGHVRRLGKASEEDILDIFQASHAIVKNCHCDEDMSCYSCIQNYRNQSRHDYLERQLAMNFFERILYDVKRIKALE